MGLLTYARPIIDYASVYGYYKKMYSVKIEHLQIFTKRLKCIYNVPYRNRLYNLGLNSLGMRRLKSDLTMYFKIIHGFDDFIVTILFPHLVEKQEETL